MTWGCLSPPGPQANGLPCSREGPRPRTWAAQSLGAAEQTAQLGPTENTEQLLRERAPGPAALQPLGGSRAAACVTPSWDGVPHKARLRGQVRGQRGEGAARVGVAPRLGSRAPFLAANPSNVDRGDGFPTLQRQ